MIINYRKTWFFVGRNSLNKTNIMFNKINITTTTLGILCIIPAVLTNLLFLIGSAFCFLVTFSCAIYLQLQKNKIEKETQDIIKTKLNNKIWSLDVTTVCAHCQSPIDFEFDLNKTTVGCDKCGNTNKLLLDILTVST